MARRHACSTRREFLAATAMAAAGTVLSTRAVRGQGVWRQRLPASVCRTGLAATAFLPEGLSAPDLQALATTGIEAATHAGATYADIRVGVRDILAVNLWYGEVYVDLQSTFTYGVRVLVDGAWGFVYGRNASPDAIAASARQAVATARGYAPLVAQRAELAPAPVATGEWATPIQEDPFTVPLHDHTAVAYAYGLAGSRVNRVQVSWNSKFEWTKETRVFASSEGALTTQTRHLLDPNVRARGIFLDPYGGDGVDMRFPELVTCSGGFEAVSDPAIPTKIAAWTEDVARIAALPWGTLEVGRYPVVFDGRSTGALLGTTLGRALELDRALGDEAGASGSSYVSPPSELLCTAIASAKLSVGAHRDMPSPTAVKWDDEGVKTHAYPLITEGRLMDYHTSRQHAMVLKDWYAQQHQPLRSHGSVLVPSADAPVMIRAPHLTITPNASAASLGTLCREISHGLLVMDMPNCRTDQQLTSAFYNVDGGTPVLELRQGQPVRRLRWIGLDINAKRLWKEQLVAVGDTSTVGMTTVGVYKGMPWQKSPQATTTPALHVKDVNVVSTAWRL